MKKVFLILLVLILIAAGYLLWVFKLRPSSHGPKGPAPVPLVVSKHSDAFNSSVQSMLQEYYSLAGALAKADTASISRFGTQLKTALDSVRIDELKKDTTGIYESALDPLNMARSEAGNILSNPALDAKRTAFNSLSENLRLLFIVSRYDREKIYWQECPTAFGEDQSGFWLSKADTAISPYASGTNCGGVKDTINFIGK
ncbi:MAG: hypothetical protein DI535_17970 [Citrobacter freundii]|nr:MAG: hypothetical protein DI535_17970 [Citrobacter freundii]